jgi:hypothetical protein
MLLFRTQRLREGPDRLYELKLDGEVVALDAEGRPSFNALQHHDPRRALLKRRALIEKHVLPALADPIRYSPFLEASLPNPIRSGRPALRCPDLRGIVTAVPKQIGCPFAPGHFKTVAGRKYRDYSFRERG